MITIHIAYAETAKKQHYFSLHVLDDCTVHDVLALPDVKGRLNLQQTSEQLSTHYGIYGKKVGLDYQLKDGDRLEIYRPLIIDPMNRRRQKHKANLKNNDKT